MIYNMLQILSKYSTFSYRGGLCPPRTPYEHEQTSNARTHAQRAHARERRCIRSRVQQIKGSSHYFFQLLSVLRPTLSFARLEKIMPTCVQIE